MKHTGAGSSSRRLFPEFDLKASAQAAAFNLFTFERACPVCGSSIERGEVTATCRNCKEALSSAFAHEKGGGAFQCAEKGPAIDSICIRPEGMALVADALLSGRKGALRKVAEAMADCMPLRDYMQVDSVFISAAGFAPAALAHASDLGLFLAQAFLCKYEGPVPNEAGMFGIGNEKRPHGARRASHAVRYNPLLLFSGSTEALRSETLRLSRLGAYRIVCARAQLP